MPKTKRLRFLRCTRLNEVLVADSELRLEDPIGVRSGMDRSPFRGVSRWRHLTRMHGGGAPTRIDRDAS